MLNTISIWLLVAAFAGAGLFNVLGTRATQQSFVRWGYPRWWQRATGALEIATALLIAVPLSRPSGLIVGAVIIGAAVLTVLRHREPAHLAPLGLFCVLITLAEISS